jgi:hypothetical protein
VRDLKKPRGKSFWIPQLAKMGVGGDEDLLAQIECVIGTADQMRQVTVNLLLPAPDQNVKRLGTPVPGATDQHSIRAIRYR